MKMNVRFVLRRIPDKALTALPFARLGFELVAEPGCRLRLRRMRLRVGMRMRMRFLFVEDLRMNTFTDAATLVSAYLDEFIGGVRVGLEFDHVAASIPVRVL